MMSDAQSLKKESREVDGLLMSYIKNKYAVEDVQLYEKCTMLSRLNLKAENFGAQKALSITLLAPVVELSVLDTYDSPEEKLTCLCTTFDLIFAELKSAMATVISKYSDKENDIPVVDNKDILPALITVIIKSKLSHLYSNMDFMRVCIQHVDEKINLHARKIFRIFQEATDKIMTSSWDSLETSAEKELHSLDLVQLMELSSSRPDFDGTNQSEEVTNTADRLLQEQTDRIIDLITTCTTAHEDYT